MCNSKKAFFSQDATFIDCAERGIYEKIYTEKDFNRKIRMPERETARVKAFMTEINQNEKTLVFCAKYGVSLGPDIKV